MTNDNTQMAPFGDHRNLPAGTNSGAVSIEQERAIAEARGQIQLAKMFPRSLTDAYNELMEACRSPEFATAAFYSVPNRGSGPSIRFAEEIARCYGNFEYGHRELSREKGKSEVEVYAWDKEKNNYSKRQITVIHAVDTKNGPKILTSQADIDNKIANVAAKQMRGRILALVSKSLVAEGIAACKATLSGQGGGQSVKDRVKKMVSTFSTQFGVDTKLIEKYIGHGLDHATTDDLTDLIGVYNALKEGAKIADYFTHDEPETKAVRELPDESKASKLGEKAAKAKKNPAAKKKPEPEPEPEVVDNEPEIAQDDATDQDDDDLDLF